MSIHPAANRSCGSNLKPAAIALLLAALLAPLALAVEVGPDAYGYRASNTATYSLLNIASSGSRILAGADDDKATINLGFPFLFYGNAYSSVCVSTNGILYFGPCTTGNDFANTDLTASVTPDNRPALAVFWTDLTFDGSGADAIYYQTSGTTPNRRFIVTWNNALAQNQPDTLTFQAILSEADNSILLQYQRVDTSSKESAKGANATIGIRDANGNTNGLRLQWSYNAPVLNDNLAIQFTPPPPACLKLYSFETSQDTGTLLSSITVNTNKSGSILSTQPGQISVDALAANTCTKPVSFDLAVTLDPAWNTNPDGKAGNATFAYTAKKIFDPKTYSPAAFGPGAPQGRSLCLSNLTLNSGSSFLMTVHAAIISGTLTKNLPQSGRFSFSTTIYTGGSNCSEPKLGPTIVGPDNPAGSTLPFTIK